MGWECGMGVEKSLYLLVRVEVWGVGNGAHGVTRPIRKDGRKKGHLGHYKKTFFQPREKDAFLTLFENC
jgi:hypothetical protein